MSCTCQIIRGPAIASVPCTGGWLTVRSVVVVRCEKCKDYAARRNALIPEAEAYANSLPCGDGDAWNRVFLARMDELWKEKPYGGH